MDLSLITYHVILPMLAFFKNVLGSYGWSIIAVTLLVKVVLYPLTKHQTESMKKMQALQPRIKVIQERFNKQKSKYKDRPEKLKESQGEFQKEMMEFYKTNKVNPLGGCLPMIGIALISSGVVNTPPCSSGSPRNAAHSLIRWASTESRASSASATFGVTEMITSLGFPSDPRT